MTDDAGLQWKRELLNKRRASLLEEARRAGSEPMPGIDWKAWHDRREWREVMMIAIDEAEVRLERDFSYIIGASSGAGFGYSEGFDPETGGTWRQSRDGGPAFTAIGAGNMKAARGIPAERESWREKVPFWVIITLGVSVAPFVIVGSWWLFDMDTLITILGWLVLISIAISGILFALPIALSLVIEIIRPILFVPVAICRVIKRFFMLFTDEE